MITAKIIRFWRRYILRMSPLRIWILENMR
jgi:hypothetical protein